MYGAAMINKRMDKKKEKEALQQEFELGDVMESLE